MTSKVYFLIAGIFMALYIITSFATAIGFPDWVHRVSTLIFAGAVFLGFRERKKEKLNEHDDKS